MISELPLGRGSVDAMGYERAKFRFVDLDGQPWVGHVVDADGRVLISEGRLAEVNSLSTAGATNVGDLLARATEAPSNVADTGSVLSGSLVAEPFLLGRSSDGVVHLLWIVPSESSIPGSGNFVANAPAVSTAGSVAAVPTTPVAPMALSVTSTSAVPSGTATSGVSEGPILVPLTQIAAELPGDESQLASRAVALAKWHATFRFCPRCGAPVVPVEAGWASQCTNCGVIEYPRMDPVVIMRVTDAKERLLLASNATWPERRMSLPAGYVEAGETPPQAVGRELWEEVQLRVENTEYLASQVWPGPRSLMLAFSATIRGGTADPVPDGVEIREARFFSKRELITAFDTGEVLGPGPSSIAYAVINDWLTTSD